MKLWSITVLSTCLKDATTCSSTHHDSWLKALPSFLFAWSNNFEYLSVSGGVALMSWGYISPGEASTCGISDLSTQRWRSIDAFTVFYQSWSPLFVGVYLFDIYLIMHGPQLFNTIHRDVYRILILYYTDLHDQFACPVPGAVQPPDLYYLLSQTTTRIRAPIANQIVGQLLTGVPWLGFIVRSWEEVWSEGVDSCTITRKARFFENEFRSSLQKWFQRVRFFRFCSRCLIGMLCNSAAHCKPCPNKSGSCNQIFASQCATSHRMIESQAEWGPLDILIIDSPPGKDQKRSWKPLVHGCDKRVCSNGAARYEHMIFDVELKMIYSHLSLSLQYHTVISKSPCCFESMF